MLTIDATQTPLKNVMNLYYSWLVDMIGPKGADKIALLSTIITFDILKESPMYTLWGFRAYADRTITISPDDFGSGNITDRYSRLYRKIIELAGYELYANAKLSDKQAVDVQKAEGDITSAIADINTINHAALTEWLKSAAQQNLKPGTPEYVLEKQFFISHTCLQ
jgi:hypothetical protein